MDCDNTYTIPYHCHNCGNDFNALFHIGKRAPRQMGCPRCGCMTAQKCLTQQAQAHKKITWDHYWDHYIPEFNDFDDEKWRVY